ncbi:MAG: chitobiase/beta-hexosaminidase C-terminal domain-containing protein, partial [Planctomycetes bacterium]|nr:chitobiase/beta-hexosaminidase C-terminal domain-containing protein [Planctomycetota bacterium]
RWEEINEGRPGANYGWPRTEGPTTNPDHQSPVYAYGENPQSISGGVFYEPLTAQFPEEYAGKYFFADYIHNNIRVLDPDEPDAADAFASGLAGPVALDVAPDGSLYYLNRNVWVRDKKFREATGSLHKVVYLPRANIAGPQITQQPQSVTRTIGEPFTLRVEAKGEGRLRYQWRRDGRNLPEATKPELTLAAAQRDHGAEFTCLVSMDGLAVTSEPARLWITPLLPPIEPESPLTLGLNFAIYEWEATSLPEFESLEPLRGGSAYGIGIPPRAPRDGFGLTFDGFITVPQSGAYSFFAEASDSCRLFVAGRDVAVVTPFATSREASGAVGLEKGRHALRLLFAHREGRPNLNVEVAGPNVSRRPLPQDWLERVNPRVLAPPLIEPETARFSGPVWIELSATTAEAVIHYTLDGHDPDGASPRYDEPFLLSRSGTVKARAFRLGGDGVPHASAVSERSFVIAGDRPFGLKRQPIAARLNITERPEDLPPRLSQTGVFASLADLAPSRGLTPYTLNTPLWSDGADKRRWIAVPGEAPIGFRPTGQWSFPAATVLVKHFEFPQADAPPRRLETRMLVVGRDGGGYGATYRWNEEQTDAELLSEAKTETIELSTAEGQQRLSWYFPSRKDCLVCHTRGAGFVLGVNTRQLNCDFTYPETGATDNQLRTWRHAGMFDEPPEEAAIAGLPRLAAIDDESAPLVHRVRSYLDANCAQCHRPGGARGTFDARFAVPLEKQNLISGKLIAADLGVKNAQVVTPGSPEHSMLYLRMNRRQDVFNMPPLASHVIDPAALDAVARWIETMPSVPPQR